MIIAGGVYHERCLAPDSSQLLGSGGRAALALCRLSSSITLHTFSPTDESENVKANFEALDVHVNISSSAQSIELCYLHPLSRPRISPIPLPVAERPVVKGEVILRYGCLEGDFRVDGTRVIYDPQSNVAPADFHANGSMAECLAVVLNSTELSALSGIDEMSEAAKKILTRANVVVVKAGAKGAFVFQRDVTPVRVPAFHTKAVYKIGSGDIFSSTFAYYWAEAGRDPISAARLASLQTANYVESLSLPCPIAPPERTAIEIAQGDKKTVYLGGPFFNTAQRWLIEEARQGLLDLGMGVFSPLHDVGVGGDSVAIEDLAGLARCNVMLALLQDMDPGTLFEVGVARSKNIPVVAYIENARPQDPTMLKGTNCVIESDFATALYRAAWMSP